MAAEIVSVDGDAADHEKIATTSSIGFTSTKIAPTTGLLEGKHAFAALVTVETADIRFTLDGTTPVVTATDGGTGHLMLKDQSYVVRGHTNVAAFRCINAVASSGAIVRATYFFRGKG
jgi:hypothetical protein